VKNEIIKLFESNVLGRRFQVSGAHDGAEGQWLSGLMGLENDSLNRPDFKGFEMKKQTRGKTTFGDWSPDKALYKKNRELFLKAFGTPSPRKKGRLSWSGEVFPKIDVINKFGQQMKVGYDGSLEILYWHGQNTRTDKDVLVPTQWQKDGLTIASWSAQKLRANFENKFDQFGWFKLLKDSSGAYFGIQFGRAIGWGEFTSLVASGDVIVDCGMYSGNPRPYMQFRAHPTIWDKFEEEIIDFR